MAAVAVVVGATGAMGDVICSRLAERGLVVIGVARSPDLLEALGSRIGSRFVACPADIGDDAATAAISAALAAVAGAEEQATVAMVVHAAGLPVAGGVLTAPTEAIVTACNIKVAGMLRLVRAVDDRLGRHSRLVAIGGHYGFEPTAYAATAGVANAALTNLVRQLSWAYGPRGVTSHLLAPGPADTPRVRRVVADRAARSGRSESEELDEMRSDSAIGEFTTIDQVAWAVTLLLDAEADAMAGSSMMLDAGRRRGLP